MNQPKGWTVLIAGMAVLAIALVVNRGKAEGESEGAPKLDPVESDMHEFMEYAFGPIFEQLKASLREAPAEGKDWVPVKAYSLVLAENGNLLMMRPSEDDVEGWNRMSAEMRDQGRLLYQAAKKRNYADARKQYEALVTKCNACHEEFAGGEYLQEP